MNAQLETPEMLYQRYRRLAYAVAHQFASKGSPQARQDLVDEADSYLGELVCTLPSSRFDPERGKLSVWLYQAICWHLMARLRLRNRRSEAERHYILERQTTQENGLRQRLEGLSEPAREVVRWILADVKKCKLTYLCRTQKLRRLLLRKWGWSPDQVRVVWLELTEVFCMDGN